MIKAVVFDFDGTIIDTESLWYKVYKEVLEEDYKIKLPLEQFAKVIGTTDEVLYSYINSQTRSPIDRTELEEKVHNRFVKLKDVLILREGVQELLEEAISLGLKLAVASSSSREWVEGFLTQFGLTEYFPVIKTKEDVAKVKPDPELYIKTIEELKVLPEETIAVEDSVNGSLAAIAANLSCVIVPNPVTSYLTFHEKALLYKDFSELSFKRLINELTQVKGI